MEKKEKSHEVVRYIIAGGLIFFLVFSGLLTARDAEKKKLLRVGVYDSRGIAIAYCHSHFASERYEKMKAQSDAAEAAGEEIKQAANKQQAKQHLQGFGTAPVHECLEYVKDQIPNVAKSALKKSCIQW